MKNALGGSDVSHVINGDHATAAGAYLVAKGLTNWEVVLPDDNMLMLDYDAKVYDGTLPEVFYQTLGIFEQAQDYPKTYFVISESKGGNTHCVVHSEKPMPIVERIAWQAAFGSDLKREALHLLSVALGDKNPILLFMRKPEPQKLLRDGNVSA